MKRYHLPSPATVLSAAVLGLVLTGCSEPPAASTSGGQTKTQTEACTLLLSSEITDVLGSPVGEGVDPNTVVPTCQWPPEGESTPFVPVVQITLVRDSAGSFDTWLSQMRAEYDESGFDFNADNYRRVDGIGEWAVYIADGGLLMVGQRGTLLQVMVSSGPDHARQVALARRALARLP